MALVGFAGPQRPFVVHRVVRDGVWAYTYSSEHKTYRRKQRAARLPWRSNRGGVHIRVPVRQFRSSYGSLLFRSDHGVASISRAKLVWTIPACDVRGIRNVRPILPSADDPQMGLELFLQWKKRLFLVKTVC